jgi:serine O-acetyltransferase
MSDIDTSIASTSPNEETLGLWQQIHEDWVAHGKDWTKPGFRAVAVQRFGVWRMTVQQKVLRAPLTILYTMLYRKVRNTYGIELPYTVKLGRRVIIEHQSAIVIHGYSEIGDDSILRQGVTLGNRYLDQPKDAPKLGKRVNVGAGAKIFGAVTIGDRANIGANAVVLKDIPPESTAVGIPAKVIKTAAPPENTDTHTNGNQPLTISH